VLKLKFQQAENSLNTSAALGSVTALPACSDGGIYSLDFAGSSLSGAICFG
jgi:hypothetical protein